VNASRCGRAQAVRRTQSERGAPGFAPPQCCRPDYGLGRLPRCLNSHRQRRQVRLSHYRFDHRRGHCVPRKTIELGRLACIVFPLVSLRGIRAPCPSGTGGSRRPTSSGIHPNALANETNTTSKTKISGQSPLNDCDKRTHVNDPLLV
jgi:hypothetical protein